jgi:DHA1 family bicyclomycin/chloramphenicol resistance-like MFS transporter
VSVFTGKSSVPMAGIMAASTFVAFVILLVGRKMIKKPVEVSADAVMVGH